MSDARPVLDQINLVTTDFESSLAFYRLLGVDLPEQGLFKKDDQPHHANAKTGGADFDLDSPAFGAAWNSGWRGQADLNGRILMTFRFDTREGVDARHAELMGAGYRSLHAPSDAFWGARFAVVEDPSGLAVGLMSRSDPAKRSAPPEF